MLDLILMLVLILIIIVLIGLVGIEKIIKKQEHIIFNQQIIIKKLMEK